MASIDKLPSGRFRVRWRGPDNRQHSESRASKADAEALRRRIERELDDGYLTSPADRRITISEYVNRNGGWLASQAWRTSTRDNFDSQWRAHLEPRWGHVAVRSVRRTDVQGWVNELSAAGLAPGTVAGVYKRLVQTCGLLTSTVCFPVSPSWGSPCLRSVLKRLSLSKCQHWSR